MGQKGSDLSRYTASSMPCLNGVSLASDSPCKAHPASPITLSPPLSIQPDDSKINPLELTKDHTAFSLIDTHPLSIFFFTEGSTSLSFFRKSMSIHQCPYSVHQSTDADDPALHPSVSVPPYLFVSVKNNRNLLQKLIICMNSPDRYPRQCAPCCLTRKST